MGNKVSKDSTDLFVYGQITDKIKNRISQLKKQRKEIGNIKDLNIYSSRLSNKYWIITANNGYADNYWINTDAGDGWRNLRHYDHIAKDPELNTKIIKVCTASHSSNTFWITKDGGIHANGDNTYNQLGEGIDTKNMAFDTKEINGLSHEQVIDVQLGSNYNIVLCGSPSISIIDQIKCIISSWTTHDDQYIPHDVIIIINDYFGRKSLNKVYSAGSGANGHGHDVHEWTLMESFVHNYKSIVAIACSENRSLFLDSNGRVYQCYYAREKNPDFWPGSRNYREYDIVQTKPKMVEYFTRNFISIIKVCSNETMQMALDQNGRIWEWKSATDSEEIWPVMIDALSEYQIVDIKCQRGSIFYAKSKDNEHWLWGNNLYGQCELKQNSRPKSANLYKNDPVLISDVFYKKTKCVIDHVYLTNTNVFIIGRK